MSVTIKGGITSTLSETASKDTYEYRNNNRGASESKVGGTYHMATNPAFYEPQRANNFEFVVTKINNLTRAGATSNTSTGGKIETVNGTTAQKILRYSVVSASVPHFTQEPITIRRGNSYLKYAGVPSFPDGKLEIVDYIGADSKSILMAWQNLSYNVKTEKVGLASDYKRDCYLIEYSPDLQVVRRWIMHGCWVSGIEEAPYNSEENAKKTVTATIQYDSAEVDVSSLTD